MERASGVRSAIQQCAQLLGAPLGGILVAAFGATAALWIDAASFLVSAALVAFLVPAAHAFFNPAFREMDLRHNPSGQPVSEGT